MNFFEIEKYKVAVRISESELDECSVTIDDILERSPKGWEYIRMLKDCAIRSTKYEWPGCAFSMEIKVMPEMGMVVIFSETIKDFVKGLKASQKIADHGSILIRELINRIDSEDEDGARKIIRDFESNVKNINKSR